MDYHNYYLDQLYPLQDRFLEFFRNHNDGRFYLTGGTALSRVYFQHRYSEDLDFFSGEELKDFRTVVGAILEDARKQLFVVEVETTSDHFLRIFIREKEVSLKIDFVNDVTFHSGGFRDFPLYGCVDNEINILANKITCITRYEVKDIADIFILAKRLSFSWREVMDIALKKSPADPLEVSKVIKTLPREELKIIKWAFDVHLDDIYADLQIIAADILLGRKNTLKS